MTDQVENDTKSSWVDVLDTLREQDVRIAHVGLFDLMGVFRERRLGMEDAAQVFDGGGTFVNVLQQWDAGESVFGKGPFVGEPVSIDPSSTRHYPFEDHACFLIADFDGPSAELSPRKLLQKQIDKAATQGLGVRAAFEFDFFILNESAASLRQTGFSSLSTFAEGNRCWSGSSAATHASLIASLSDVLASGGVDMLSLGMELGPGCFEATLRHKDAMVAADNAAVFKLISRAFCRRQDLTASFMAQVDSGFSGLSGHIHLSLYDLETGLDLFPDAADGRGMSDLFKYFIGGMLEMAPHSMLLTHHTVNAYRRHSPGNWAPKSVSWAVQNYSAAVRVVPYPPGACRLEYRLPGSDINPYPALAFVLGAGLWGTENEMTLPEEFLCGGPDEMPQDGARLPHDLFEAIENTARSSHAAEIWSDRFVSGGKNELRDQSQLWLPADTGWYALGGMISHLNALVAIGSSTVNSYRRLNDTGMWAPVGASWGLQNRSCAIRVSSPDRFEFRCVDSMVNPCLMQAALLKAFDDGIKNRIEPGAPEERNFVDVLNSGEKVERIPTTLRDALDALADDEVIKSALPGHMHTIYDWYKRDEWNKFIWQVSDWEVKMYLDCMP